MCVAKLAALHAAATLTPRPLPLTRLQCRSGKRTGAAAVKIAVDLVNEGAASTDRAITLVEPGHLDQLLHPQFADVAAYAGAVMGTGACSVALRLADVS